MYIDANTYIYIYHTAKDAFIVPHAVIFNKNMSIRAGDLIEHKSELKKAKLFELFRILRLPNHITDGQKSVSKLFLNAFFAY